MDVQHVAKLANLPMSDADLAKQATNLQGVMELVEHIQKLDTTGVEPTAQVSGKVNVTRADVIDTTRMLTQAAALANASDSHNGFFRVAAVFNE